MMLWKTFSEIGQQQKETEWKVLILAVPKKSRRLCAMNRMISKSASSGSSKNFLKIRRPSNGNTVQSRWWRLSPLGLGFIVPPLGLFLGPASWRSHDGGGIWPTAGWLSCHSSSRARAHHGWGASEMEENKFSTISSAPNLAIVQRTTFRVFDKLDSHSSSRSSTTRRLHNDSTSSSSFSDKQSGKLWDEWPSEERSDEWSRSIARHEVSYFPILVLGSTTMSSEIRVNTRIVGTTKNEGMVDGATMTERWGKWVARRGVLWLVSSTTLGRSRVKQGARWRRSMKTRRMMEERSDDSLRKRNEVKRLQRKLRERKVPPGIGDKKAKRQQAGFRAGANWPKVGGTSVGQPLGRCLHQLSTAAASENQKVFWRWRIAWSSMAWILRDLGGTAGPSQVGPLTIGISKKFLEAQSGADSPILGFFPRSWIFQDSLNQQSKKFYGEKNRRFWSMWKLLKMLMIGFGIS